MEKTLSCVGLTNSQYEDIFKAAINGDQKEVTTDDPVLDGTTVVVEANPKADFETDEAKLCTAALKVDHSESSKRKQKKSKAERLNISDALFKRNATPKLKNCDMKEYGYEIWVQCSNQACSKWRRLHNASDTSVLVDVWTCDMNKDTMYNSCSTAEEDCSYESDVETDLQPGSLVWAKQFGYPWWPGMVENDPETEKYFLASKKKGVMKYHVTFFDNVSSRSWIPTYFIKPFENSMENMFSTKGQNGRYFTKRIADAVRKANCATKMSMQKRLDEFGFSETYNQDAEMEYKDTDSSQDSEGELSRKRKTSKELNQKAKRGKKTAKESTEEEEPCKKPPRKRKKALDKSNKDDIQNKQQAKPTYMKEESAEENFNRGQETPNSNADMKHVEDEKDTSNILQCTTSKHISPINRDIIFDKKAEKTKKTAKEDEKDEHITSRYNADKTLSHDKSSNDIHKDTDFNNTNKMKCIVVKEIDEPSEINTDARICIKNKLSRSAKYNRTDIANKTKSVFAKESGNVKNVKAMEGKKMNCDTFKKKGVPADLEKGNKEKTFGEKVTTLQFPSAKATSVDVKFVMSKLENEAPDGVDIAMNWNNRPPQQMSTRERLQYKVKQKGKKRDESKYTVEQLLEKAGECADSCNVELAAMFCQRALEMEPDHLQGLDMAGSLQAELGNVDKAQRCLLRAVELSPDEGHAKYMYLGQLSTGADAVGFFSKGVEIMARTLQAQPAQAAAASLDDGAEVTPRDVSAAYCSIAEIYLTDLCMEEGSSERCKQTLGQALEADSSNPEALQLMASYLFSTEQPQEGKVYLLQSLSAWLPSRQQGQEAENRTEAPDDATEMLAQLPPYESRISTAKLLSEVEEYELASDVLEGLLEEDDEVVQVWYLLGWVSYLQAKCAPPDEAAGQQDSARTCLHKAKKLAAKLGCDDEAMMAHVEEVMAELGPGDGPPDSEDDDAAPMEDGVDDEEELLQSSDEEEVTKEDEHMEQ
ncbi:uncharacterized protein LOC116948411 isoform X2 [Petromyzon marinus]|uniref:uncharacterized protein LOC116948411 isoform X2 n=1 Tax=Petromyzon marinus TaxID=7757 RepID=UPI003F7061C8